jgi:hypothetical protein
VGATARIISRRPLSYTLSLLSQCWVYSLGGHLFIFSGIRPLFERVEMESGEKVSDRIQLHDGADLIPEDCAKVWKL